MHKTDVQIRSASAPDVWAPILMQADVKKCTKTETRGGEKNVMKMAAAQIRFYQQELKM